MVSRNVLELCTSPTTLISELAKEPNQPISRVAKQLFKHHGARFKQNTNAPSVEDEADELGIVARCGSFPQRPSDLFLQVYRDVLRTLDTDPLAGVVSPSLLGTSGVIPLSIVSVIPDIMRHYAELIVRAETEIILMTNYWEKSASSSIISDSLRRLSKRVEARGGTKVVMKLMYDRGNVKQVVKNRIPVKPVYWSRIGLPTEDEIPGISLEVVNYHRPLLGTFHAKFLVVDRRVACLNSNNVQDRPNIEMMVQLEGPVVDGIYETALLSWSDAMNPPLPLLATSRTLPDVYRFQQDNQDLKYINPRAMSRATRIYLREQHAINDAQGDQPRDVPAAEEKHADLIIQHPNMRVPSFSDELGTGLRRDSNSEIGGKQTVPPWGGSAKENGENSARSPASFGSGDAPTDSNPSNNRMRHEDGRPVNHTSREQDESMTNNASDGAADPVPLPGDGDDTWSDFRPHILHEPHQPVPIAFVNRWPTGSPGHYSLRQIPQNVAWLSAMRYAQKSVFIQTPTFNAAPIVSSALDACRRGVKVTLYLDLGFNDQGEMIPFQGGTNEEVVHKMYKALNAEGKGAEKRLEVFWFTGKDQTKPLKAAMKKRNCHVKFMSIDDQIAILGNGNQDTQSWFHSQEVNVMVDSPGLVGAWQRGIDANQNTRLYGRVSDKDGIWRNEDGEVLQASGVAASSFFKRLKGLYSMMKRISGTAAF